MLRDVILRDGCSLRVVDQRPQGSQAPRSAAQPAPDPAEPDVVLWLQGLGVLAAAWGVQLAHFGRTVRSLAPDQRGVGESSAPPGPYATRQLAEDAAEVLAACGVERAHVVGLSLGGAVAQELALAHPGRVRTLALLATFPCQSPRSAALLQAWRELYPTAHRGPDERAAWEKQAYAWLFSERFWRGESNVRAALSFAAGRPLQTPDGYRGQVDAALAHDARDRLGAIGVPALVLHGALDQLAPAAGAEELARRIPGAELRILPDVGHAVNLEAQREVHAALRALWAKG
jgi:pimeloyl-ACP methyl ester carboxylesterase